MKQLGVGGRKKSNSGFTESTYTDIDTQKGGVSVYARSVS